MRFVGARHYTPGRIEHVRLLVIHDMESPEARSTAENVAAWFAGPTAPEASAHYCVDPDSIVRCVHLRDTAWGAPGANADGIQYELAGYASQSRRDWLDKASAAILDRAAEQMARDALAYDIRLRWLTDAQLADGRSSGIVEHRDVTRVLNGGIGHTDAGPDFPRDVLLNRVKWYAARLTKVHPQPTQHLNVPTWPFGPRDYIGVESSDVHCHSGYFAVDRKHIARFKRRMRVRGWKMPITYGRFVEGDAHAVAAFRGEKNLGHGGTVNADVWRAAWELPVT